MKSLPLFAETVLDAHQICHSGFSGDVSDISFPQMIRFSWFEEISGLCSSSVLRSGKAQITVLEFFPDSLLIPLCVLIPQYCPYPPEFVCWPF